MKLILIAGVVILASFSGNRDAGDVVNKMYAKYRGNWYHSFSFNQTTENYRNDSLIRTATWYENIVFPDKFRIDFGDKKDGNAVIYDKDSSYSFRKGKLARTGVNDDDLTFLLGGMYYYPLDSVKAILGRDGYDLHKYHEDSWQGRAVYVIGAYDNNEKASQLWIDKERLILLRFIKFSEGRKEEGVFSGHQPFGKAWSETACDFYINDKLVQKEKYHDCQANGPVDMSLFDPYSFHSIQ